MASSLRQDQARLTQRRIVEAARALLAERGYAATTISAIAAAAGVAVPTVYKSFGTKTAIFKRAYDIAVVGDDEPVPLGARPEAAELMAERDLGRLLTGYASLVTTVNERTAPLLTALLAAAEAGDAELREFTASVEAERMAGNEHFARHLVAVDPAIDGDRAKDLLWLYTSPEVYRRLVQQRDWPAAAFRAWLAESLLHQLRSA